MKLLIEDLQASKTLDIQALKDIRGGHGTWWHGSMDIESILEKVMGLMPKNPMPEPKMPDVVPWPIEPYGVPGTVDPRVVF